jgi:hypothetical protein
VKHDALTATASFMLEYVIRRVQGDQEKLKFNGTHQLLVYVDDINLFRKDINTKTVVGVMVINQQVIIIQQNHEVLHTSKYKPDNR